MSNPNRHSVEMTKEMFLTKVMNYEENTEEWVYLGDKPCIIDFYANWCGPCGFVAPILEQVAEEYKDRIDVYKVNTETEQELAGVFGIRSIPSFLFCPTDDKPDMIVGVLDREKFEHYIKEFLIKEEVKK